MAKIEKKYWEVSVSQCTTSTEIFSRMRMYSTAIMRELVKETKKTARNHSVVEEIFGAEMQGRFHKISGDIGRVYKQVTNSYARL